MKKLRFMYVLAMLTCIAACDDDDNDKNEKELKQADERFVEKAALSNMTEVDFGNLASTQGESDAVRAFAQQMISEHNSAQQELKSMADDYKNADWPKELDTQHKEAKQQLMSLSGRAFDSAYMQSQVMDHNMTLTIFENVLDSGENASVKAYANKYQPHIQEHLAKADSVLNVVLSQSTNGN